MRCFAHYAFAIALEMFSMGIATALEMMNEGISKKKSIIHIVALSSLFIVSAVLGGNTFTEFRRKMDGVGFIIWIICIIILSNRRVISRSSF